MAKLALSLLSCCCFLVAAGARNAGGGVHRGAAGGRRVKRIIGGERVDIESVPYVLSLRLDGRHVCGAVVIGDEWCLTAAHCCVAPSTGGSRLSLRSGTSSLRGGGESHRVSRLVRHELYRADNDDYDLCALRVEPSFAHSDVTAPAKLPSPNASAAASGSVCGWGYAEADAASLSPYLRSMNVSRVSLEDCKYAYRYSYTVHEHDVCYGSANGYADACQGDSGGPLVDEHSQLVGIVSFGGECGYTRLPGVYVDVQQFRHWIKATTGL